MAGKVGLCPSLHADNAMAKNRMCVCTSNLFNMFSVPVRVGYSSCSVYVTPNNGQRLIYLHKTAIKQGTSLMLWCYYREQQGVTEKPPSPTMQPIKAFTNPHSVSNRLTTSGASLNYFNKYCVLVQVSCFGWFIIFVRWNWWSANK